MSIKKNIATIIACMLTLSVLSATAQATDKNKDEISKAAFEAGKKAYQLKKFKIARKYFTTACNSGESSGCKKLADMWRKGEGGDQDKKVAFDFYESSCSKGNGSGCAYVGFFYYLGAKPIPKNHKKSFKYFEKSCMKEYSQGCYYLGISYGKGRGIEKNEDNSIKFLALGCKYGLSALSEKRFEYCKKFKTDCNNGLKKYCY